MTDAVRLTAERVREIERSFAPVLRSARVVFGIHLAHAGRDQGIRIELECQPLDKDLEHLRTELAASSSALPSGPRPSPARALETRPSIAQCAALQRSADVPGECAAAALAKGACAIGLACSP